MAKPAKAESGGNGYDPGVVQNIVGRIEDCFDEIESERGKFMKKCRDIRESISNLYDEADARGIPKKELRVMVKARGKLKSARDLIEELEQDQRETVELLAEAFGDAADLPLFKSKIERTGAQQGDGAAAHG